MTIELTSHARLERIAARSTRAFDACFTGQVDARIYRVLRIGLAGLLLIRSADWLRPWLSLEHHVWVRGFDFSWSVAEAPYLESPLIPGLILGARATWWCVRLRATLALALLLGIRPRWAALFLTVLNYTLLFADRYRYFHHLHVLYLGIAWLALAPEPAPGVHPALLPIWPLQILRTWVVGIYVAAGSAKLDPAWQSGDSLAILSRLRVLHGKYWLFLHELGTFSTLGKLVCITELGLAALLVLRPTRRVALVMGALFHTLTSCVMQVSTFGATMVLLLLAFWPKTR